MTRTRRTVGFADLTNWTRAAEQLGDRGAVALLEDAYRSAGDAIVKHGGTIHKYIGDGMMFWFDDPKCAVAAVQELVAFQRTVGDLEIRRFAALATGEVAVVTVGHPSKREEDVIGATVNRAGKLMAQAHRSADRWACCEVTAREAGIG